MNAFQPQRRQSRSQRAVALVLVILVNAGIAVFIDRLAATGPGADEMAAALTAANARA